MNRKLPVRHSAERSPKPMVLPAPDTQATRCPQGLACRFCSTLLRHYQEAKPGPFGKKAQQLDEMLCRSATSMMGRAVTACCC